MLDETDDDGGNDNDVELIVVKLHAWRRAQWNVDVQIEAVFLLRFKERQNSAESFRGDVSGNVLWTDRSELERRFDAGPRAGVTDCRRHKAKFTTA